MPRLTIAAGLVGFAAVALGAFGAHALDGGLDSQALDWWRTATLYALVHAAAALAIALAGRLAAAGWAFIIGTAVFAGTLYAMALGAPRMLGAVTPVGGVLLLAGWALIAWKGARR